MQNSRKAKILKELTDIYKQSPPGDLIDIYYRLNMILNDLKNIIDKSANP